MIFSLHLIEWSKIVLSVLWPIKILFYVNVTKLSYVCAYNIYIYIDCMSNYTIIEKCNSPKISIPLRYIYAVLFCLQCFSSLMDFFLGLFGFTACQPAMRNSRTFKVNGSFFVLFFLCSFFFFVLFFFQIILWFRVTFTNTNIQFCNLKYSYLILIICAQLYGFN